MMTCPQCKQLIEGLHVMTYAVGWCEKDVHLDCLPLHIRSCKACRWHNEDYLAKGTVAA